MKSNDSSFSISKLKQLYRFIWQKSASQQLVICSIALLTLPLTLTPIELQRRIIDDAISTSNVGLLYWLVGIYAAIILAQQIVKYAYNYLAARLSEYVIRILRKEILVETDSESNSDNNEDGTIVSMLTGEVEPIGGFAGVAFAQLVTEGGVLLVIFGYMLYTEFWLALVAIVAFIPQAIATPLVQNQINEQASLRISEVRAVGNDVVAVNRGDQKRSESAIERIQSIFDIRLIIFRLKFALKAVLNLLDHCADLAVLGVGGYMVIKNQSEIGVVVAFLSGLSTLRSPWRTLITYFRVASDAQLRFGLLQERLAAPIDSEATNTDK